MLTFPVGMDLAGNTFWEFRDQINIGRLRRIVEYDGKAHYADVKLARMYSFLSLPSSIAPTPTSRLTVATAQWVQWLRHTREEPPSISEQQQDIIRQAQMKQLAAQADARWASKASALDAPIKQTPHSPALPGTPRARENEVQDSVVGLEDVVQSGESAKDAEGRGEVQVKDTARTKREEREGPYQGLKLGKEGEQVPESWAPKPARRR
jgi:NADH dehydrogenase [ubiquinone] 1 alpha subcomplex assembly factor 2